MDIYYLFAYITGGLIILLSLLTFIFPKRKLTLVFKTSLDLMAFLNCLFIFFATKDPDFIAGIVTNVIATIRDMVFYFRNKAKALNHIAWPIGFAALNAGSLIFTYRSPISILPVVGSVISTLSLYNNDQRVIKIGGLIAASFYLTYYAIKLTDSDILTIFSLLDSAASIVSSFVGLIILFVRKRNEKVSE